jgi:hypothetical protein
MTNPTPPLAPPYQPPPTASPAKFGRFAWSSLILGIVGIVFSPLPIINNISALAAVVGIILGLIALFGSRKILALIGTGLCVLAMVFTVLKQNSDVAKLDEAFGELEKSLGNDPAAMSDVTASNCSVTNEFGTPFTRATVKITNNTNKTQTYSATISVNDASGTRVGEINAFSNSLAAGQSVTLSGANATGNAANNAKPGPATCAVASVNRFPS